MGLQSGYGLTSMADAPAWLEKVIWLVQRFRSMADEEFIRHGETEGRIAGFLFPTLLGDGDVQILEVALRMAEKPELEPIDVFNLCVLCHREAGFVVLAQMNGLEIPEPTSSLMARLMKEV